MLPITLATRSTCGRRRPSPVALRGVRLVPRWRCPLCDQLAGSLVALQLHLTGPDHQLPRGEAEQRSWATCYVAVPEHRAGT